MAELDFSWVKENPEITIGAIVIGGALLYLYLRRSSGSSGGTVAASGPNAMDYQVAMQNNSLSAQAAGQTRQLSAQLDLARIQADAGKSADENALEARLKEISAGLTVQSAQIAAQQTLGLDVNATQRGIAQLQADTQVAINRSNNYTTTNLAQIAADQSLHLADLSATTTRALIEAQTASTLAQIQGNVNIASIQGATSTAMARLNSDVAIRQTDNSLAMVKAAQSGMTTRSIIGAIAGLF